MHHLVHRYLISLILPTHAYGCMLHLFSMIPDAVSLFSSCLLLMSLVSFTTVFDVFIRSIKVACGVGLSSLFGSSMIVSISLFLSFFMSMAVMALLFSVFLLVTSSLFQLFWDHNLILFFLAF